MERKNSRPVAIVPRLDHLVIILSTVNDKIVGIYISKPIFKELFQ